MLSFRARVRQVVEAIPHGKVCSYGVVAELAGSPGAARAVGPALRAMDAGDEVPWWRVVSARGTISTSRADHTAQIQRALLEEEGVAFDARDRIDMDTHAWYGGESDPDGPAASR